jgi:tRNA A-37 threonylcarbamoyl transferase component Bud32
MADHNIKPPASGGAWYEHGALFADDTVLQLAEHLQPSELLGAVSTGCALSQLHTHGFVHGDLHGRNALFHAHTGVAGLVDVQDLQTQTTELSATRMATDFFVPLASMGFSWCQALLAGHLKVARLSIGRQRDLVNIAEKIRDMLGSGS